MINQWGSNSTIVLDHMSQFQISCIYNLHVTPNFQFFDSSKMRVTKNVFRAVTIVYRKKSKIEPNFAIIWGINRWNDTKLKIITYGKHSLTSIEKQDTMQSWSGPTFKWPNRGKCPIVSPSHFSWPNEPVKPSKYVCQKCSNISSRILKDMQYKFFWSR